MRPVYARSGNAALFHIVSGPTVNTPVKFTLCGQRLEPFRTQVVTDEPERVCTTCRQALHG